MYDYANAMEKTHIGITRKGAAFTFAVSRLINSGQTCASGPIQVLYEEFLAILKEFTQELAEANREKKLTRDQRVFAFIKYLFMGERRDGKRLGDDFAARVHKTFDVSKT